MSLSAEELAQIREHVGRNSEGQRVIRISNGDGGFRKLIDAVVVAAVLAGGALVWKQSNEMAAMTERISGLADRVSDLAGELRTQRRAP
jgi:hypothetical protein